MKVGIDISYKNISVALLKDNKPVNFIDEPICDRKKRDCNRVIMDKVLKMIHDAVDCRIQGIGLSLPSTIDEKRGMVYDLKKIPYWKGQKVKRILEDEFNTSVRINYDVNCFILAEKHYGMCNGFSDIVAIKLDPGVGTSVTIDGKLFVGNRFLFNNARCLSIPRYDCVRFYKESYLRTVNELSYLINEHFHNEDGLKSQKVWDELGELVGRLVTILLCNYNSQAIVLGGSLAKYYIHYAQSMDKYLEKFIHPQVYVNLVTMASVMDHPCSLGATSLISPVPVLA